MTNCFLACCLSALLHLAASFSSTPDATPVALPGRPTQVLIDEHDYEGVRIAATTFLSDLHAVTGQEAALIAAPAVPHPDAPTVIVGTIGCSAAIDRLISDCHIQASDLKGRWESFVIASVPHPSGQGRAVAIAGSDKRGTIYGIYELSRAMGVSPWHWWADVPVQHHSSVYLSQPYFASGEPAVRYRGIFINDENPCLQTWARQKFGGMNSDMYRHVFELMLRLRANLLWPGMWGSFPEDDPGNNRLYRPDGSYEGNCFNEDDPSNPAMADRYGIVIGTSHHEPMQRSQQEWFRHRHEYGNGEWNYQTNRDGVRRFWRDGIEHTRSFESMITVGMRGDDDKPMVDMGSAKANFRMLGQIIRDQQQIIASVTRQPASRTPQVWTLYSEQLDYFDAGLSVPDNVIIVLCDDNFGDVRRLPTQPHPGGYGMYYHVSYYGAPRAQKWLNQSQIQQHWEQLQATYDYGVDKLWILNVGDIKPHEFQTSFFMDMAWAPKAFSADSLLDYTVGFYSEAFGAEHGPEIAHLMDLHHKYSAYVNAELMDPATFSLSTGEFRQVTDQYLALEARAWRQYFALPPDSHDAYWQLVLYPVSAMANLYQMYYAAAMNRQQASGNDPEANQWAQQVTDCYRRDSLLAHYFNHDMSRGKWDHMMDQRHIGFDSWHTPRQSAPPAVTMVPEASDADSWTFVADHGLCTIEAQHTYRRIAPSSDAQWTVIPNLGRTLSTIALTPYTQPVQGGALEYLIEIPDREFQSSAQLHVVLRSTMPFLQGGHGYRVSINQSAPLEVNYNRDLNWENKYTLMYPTAADRVIHSTCTLTLAPSADHRYLLRIEPTAPGVALQKLVLDLGGYAPTRLFGPESPHQRIITLSAP